MLRSGRGAGRHRATSRQTGAGGRPAGARSRSPRCRRPTSSCPFCAARPRKYRPSPADLPSPRPSGGPAAPFRHPPHLRFHSLRNTAKTKFEGDWHERSADSAPLVPWLVAHACASGAKRSTRSGGSCRERPAFRPARVSPGTPPRSLPCAGREPHPSPTASSMSSEPRRARDPRIPGAPTRGRRVSRHDKSRSRRNESRGSGCSVGELHEHALAGAGVDSVVCGCDLLERYWIADRY
jgi:hypothetical protein